MVLAVDQVVTSSSVTGDSKYPEGQRTLQRRQYNPVRFRVSPALIGDTLRDMQGDTWELELGRLRCSNPPGRRTDKPL